MSLVLTPSQLPLTGQNVLFSMFSPSSGNMARGIQKPRYFFSLPTNLIATSKKIFCSARDLISAKRFSICLHNNLGFFPICSFSLFLFFVRIGTLSHFDHFLHWWHFPPREELLLIKFSSLHYNICGFFLLVFVSVWLRKLRYKLVLVQHTKLFSFESNLFRTAIFGFSIINIWLSFHNCFI